MPGVKMPKPDRAAFRQWHRWLNAASASLAGLALLAMVFIGALDVVLSRGLNLSVVGAREITELLMVAAALLGMALSQQRREHVRVTLLIDRLPPAVQGWLDRFSLLLSMQLMLAISVYGFHSTFQSFQSGEFSPGSLAVPIWPARLALSIGAMLMALECLAQLAGRPQPPSGTSASDGGPD
uniref:TRAP transporter small permease protein n=1 Tax=Marinobacter nauticus TaxID=2743 RepID=A0A455WED7_MARNT|nr:membrane protein [Marinobacter nauticus]